jgi:choline-sulfatase
VVEYHETMPLARCSLFPRILSLLILTAIMSGKMSALPLRGPQGGAAPQAVILISVDTLRADHLSCYGYSRLRTPHIDSLAQGGTLFTQINSQAPITLPSHVSLLTSTYPFANAIRENAQVLPPGAVTLATALASQGYATAAFIGGYFLKRQYGLAQGFEAYDSPFDTRLIRGGLDLKRPASEVLKSAEHWLDQHSSQAFFVFIHLFDLHQPYDAPAAFRARAPDSEYDQELAYVDDSLGSFFYFLTQHGVEQRALVVLFADHGESLGDHGESTHGYFIYNSTLHVPLIFHWPHTSQSRNSEIGGQESEQNLSSTHYLPRVDAPAGLIDVAPTILNFLVFQQPASFCGHSLLELAKGATVPPRDVYSESSYAHDKFGWAVLRTLRQGDYQYIEAPHPELYDLKHDPAEMHNLLPGRSALAVSYRERLTAMMGTYRSSSAIATLRGTSAEPSSAENLRSLGYLEIKSPHPSLEDSGVDPKDRLFEYKRFLLAGHLARLGKAAEAAAEFQAILADDPRNLPAYIELARSDLALRRYLDGAHQLETALALDPRNAEAEELLGDIWMAVGNLERAAAEFHTLLTFAPEDYEGHFGLGLIAAQRGKASEAIEQFHTALTVNPRSAEAHYQLGLSLEKQLRNREAEREFQAALQINPKFQDARRALNKLTLRSL